eukprot:tig00021366_g20850.t1
MRTPSPSSSLSLEKLPDDVLWLVLERLGAADAFDSVAGACRRLRDLVRGHGTWQSLALEWPYLRKHMEDFRDDEEEKWPIVDPKRILKAWAARVEKGVVKAREFVLDTAIEMTDAVYDDFDRYSTEYGNEMDSVGDPASCAKFWGFSVPFLRFLRHMGSELQSISVTHGGISPPYGLSPARACEYHDYPEGEEEERASTSTAPAP